MSAYEPTIGEKFEVEALFRISDMPHDKESEDLYRRAFYLITNNEIQWAQANGRFKSADDPARGYAKWQLLLTCCWRVVNASKGLPYAGRITNAKIMADAMQMLREDYQEDAPKCWYAIIKKLREQHYAETARE